MAPERGGVIRRSRKTSLPGPRILAVSVLSEWFSAPPGQRGPLEEFADSHLRKAALAQADAALFWEIVFGSVRWRRLLEWHLKKHLRKPGSLPLPVRMTLLAGTYQIIFLSRIPFFAAVDESVKAVRAMGFSWARGLVNAVLRKVSSSSRVVPEDEGFFEDRCRGNFLNCLSVFSSHPHWMVKRWEKQWGRADAVSICLSNNILPPLTIRVNRLKTDREHFLFILKESGIDAERGKISPDALIIPGFRGRIEKLPGFDEGLFQVQDEASQLVSLMLDPRPGQKVLDMCAGVGGKSTHIAAIMEDRGKVFCTDTNQARLQKLQENAARLGTGITEILPASMTKEMKRAGSLRFDKILVDAPCSGTGVIRRHPDIKWNRTPDMLKSLRDIQKAILEDAAALIAPGGILVYSVCTLEKEESSQLIREFSGRNRSFSLINARKLLPEPAGDIVTEEGFFRVLPGQLGMDGFFAAVMKFHVRQ